MTSRDFCYWLQGWFELNTTIDHREGANPETMQVIKQHLAMVFVHEIDPSHGGAEEQAKLNALHNPTALTGMEKIQAHNEQAAKTGGPMMRC